MLILMRRAGEEIKVTLEDGRVITITLISMDRNRARIGIDADRSITVDRAEIYERKNREADGNGADAGVA